MMFVFSFQIVVKVCRKKVVLEDELPDEAFSKLDIEAIGKNIIEVPDSESAKVL